LYTVSELQSFQLNDLIKLFDQVNFDQVSFDQVSFDQVNFDQVSFDQLHQFLKFSSRILDRSIIHADFVAFRSLLIRPFKFIHSNFKILKGKKFLANKSFS
jgi:hypothetical protein